MAIRRYWQSLNLHKLRKIRAF